MLQNIKTETQDTRKRVRAFVPKVNTQRTVLFTFPTTTGHYCAFGRLASGLSLLRSRQRVGADSMACEVSSLWLISTGDVMWCGVR
jgi:hypothetical protein